MYLAIALFTDEGSGQSITLSYGTTFSEAEDVATFVCNRSNMPRENLNTVLLLQNGANAPIVINHWSAAEEDF